MQTTKLFISILLASTLFSCSDNNQEEEDEKKTPPAEAIEFQPVPDKELIYKITPSSGAQLLGAGYDATADYLSFKAIKAPVFDLEALMNDDEDNIIYANVHSSEPKNYVGANANSLLQSMAYFAELENTPQEESQTAPLFAGTLLQHDAFLSDYDHSSQYAFAYCEQIFTEQRRWLVPFYLSGKQKYRFLTPEFTKDAKELSAEAIIQKYGTHILTDIGVGIRYRGLFRTTVPTATTKAETEKVAFYSALAKMQQSGIFTGSIVGGEEEITAQSVGGQLIVEFFGGETSLLSLRPTYEEFKAWFASSLNETNYTLTQILHNALPIYQMIQDESKRDQVKEAVKNYLATCRLNLTETTSLLQAWNGNGYSYFNSYQDCKANSQCKYEGAICSLYKNQKMNTTQLYLYLNGEEQRLSTETLDAETGWKHSQELGYIYTSRQEGTIPLFEATNGKAYYYSIEDKAAYGKQGSWKKTKIIGYVMPL
ncbi:MAC/perforin domain-containing protein [Bacteroides sp.]|uniref:MAC/perforin domain-containing protein n=1 Tax=Bacteroides sp. TaxID=29523 RepID=UPI002636BE33|nr:MAC/perforin domain-containing protein [Bacteroides sp.]